MRHRNPFAPRPFTLSAALVLAAAGPAVAAHPARAPLPRIGGVAVHHGFGGEASTHWHGGGAGIGAGYAPIGYLESGYGREDDAALFAQRYGCARPIWNPKSNRYIPACN